jgi:hypothetical protein
VVKLWIRFSCGFWAAKEGAQKTTKKDTLFGYALGGRMAFSAIFFMFCKVGSGPLRVRT